jgi:hypothetical protein
MKDMTQREPDLAMPIDKGWPPEQTPRAKVARAGQDA